MGMKKTLILITVFLIASFPALAGFDEGKAAYDKKDWQKAIAELRPAAEAGDDRAMMLIANMYSEGLGVIRSYKEAFSLYQRAATEKKNAEAMLALGAMYTSGLGTKTSFIKASKWYERASLLGDQQGAFFHATLLFRGNKADGDDLKPDLYAAYKWYKIASAGQNKKIAQAAAEIATILAQEKLKPADATKAAAEAAAFKPVNPEGLPPAPAE